MGFMDELDEEYAPGWKPEPGDTIQGIVVGKSNRTTKWGTYPILTVRRISGSGETAALTVDRAAIHCQGTALQGWVEDNEIDLGDRVGLRYNGKKANKDGSNSYHDYNRVHHPASQVPDHLKVPLSAAKPTSFSNSAAAPAEDEPW